jgi:hypothetical protein
MLLLANNTQVFQHLYFSVCCGGVLREKKNGSIKLEDVEHEYSDELLPGGRRRCDDLEIRSKLDSG